MTASASRSNSFIPVRPLPLLGSILVAMPLFGCVTPNTSNADSVQQRVEKVASCVYDHVTDRFANDKSTRTSLSWNADNTVATIAVRGSSFVRATYRVEWRWDTVSIESKVSDLTANEANAIAQETTMHDICLSAGGF